MITNPSWGYYKTRDESAFPELWDGCIGAWCPALGPETFSAGGRILDLSGSGDHLIPYAANQEYDSILGVTASRQNTGKYWTGKFLSTNECNKLNASPGMSMLIHFNVSDFTNNCLCGSTNLHVQFLSNIAYIGNYNAGGYRFELSSNGGVVENTWNIIVLTLNQKRNFSSVYINGELKGESTCAALAFSYPGPHSSLGYPYYLATQKAAVASYMLYDRALSADEAILLSRFPLAPYVPRAPRRLYSFAPSFFAALARRNSTSQIIGGGIH